MRLEDAMPIAEATVAQLQPYCDRIEIAGSVARRCLFVKDIEIVAVRRRRGTDLAAFAAIVDGWQRIRGDATGKYAARFLPGGIQLDLFMCEAENWGVIKAIRTGNAAFSTRLVMRASRVGYSVSGGWLTKDNVRVPMFEEQDFFVQIGLPWVPPEERNT